MSVFNPNPRTKLTPQNIQNLSFDKDLNVLAVEMLGYYAAGNQLVRLKVDANGQVVINTTDLDDRYVNVTGDTMTGNLIFSDSGEGVVLKDSGSTQWLVTVDTAGHLVTSLFNPPTGGNVFGPGWFMFITQ